MRNRLLLFAVFFIGVQTSFGQMVGTDVFLQGQWLEIGVNRMGAFGTCSSPGTYHPHVCCGTVTAFTPGGNLDAAYDWGHDGWSVGSPALMGNYTIPGYPQEGWSIQVGATEYRNWAGGAVCTGPFNVPGGVTSYSNTGGRAIGNWTGNIVGLNIQQETRVDTLASWVVVTTKIYNTTLAPIANVYYERTCDPDNTSFWSGTPTTRNKIVHQNEDARHMVQVVAHGNTAAVGTTPAYNRFNSYMALATRDCRAKCGTCSGLFPSTTPSNLWAGTGGVVLSALNDSNYVDQGIWLVFNIGTIAASDSAIVSYAYIYNYDNHTGIDSAFPDPVLTVAGTQIAQFDTVDGCLFAGIDSLPLDILYGDDKAWSWSKWTWTPSTGLTSTTGVHTFVRLSSLPGDITYTVTGTDSATGMRSCNTRQIIFTIHSCHSAYANDPCLGDGLHLGMTGDSLGATYSWTGPGGFTSLVHSPWRYPTTWADTGMYRVIRVKSGIIDTDYVHVVIHPLPVVSPTSNIPNMCDPQMDPMILFVNLDSIGETFAWTGPGGFTSTLQNPSLPGFDSSKEGTYTVTGTTVWGCKATASTSVIPGINPGFIFQVHYGCYYDTVYFTNTSYNAKTYDWYFGDATAAMHTRHTMHVYKAANRIWPVTLHLANDNCDTTIIINVDLRHEINAEFEPTPDTICLGTGAVVGFLNTSNAVDSMFTGLAPSAYAWYFGDGGTDNSATPTHTYMTPGKFPVKLVVSDAMGCQDSMARYVYVIHLDIKSFKDTMLCISQPLAMRNEITIIPDIDIRNMYKFSWTQSEPNLDDTTVQIPNLSGIGDFYNVLTVTIPGVPPDGCPALDTVHVRSVLGRKLQQLTVTQTIDYGASIQLNANNAMLYYWLPNDGSLNNNNISNPVASPIQTTTYTVFGIDVNGCRDSAYITIHVDTSMTQDIPTGFTPNGDGLNDVFRPVGIKFQRMVEFRVFNRWGQELFFTNNKEEGWDGTFHGMKQDLGVYNYLIIVAKPGGDNIVYKGNVTLIR